MSNVKLKSNKTAMTSTERSELFRRKKRAAGITEVRHILAPLSLHAEIKQMIAEFLENYFKNNSK